MGRFGSKVTMIDRNRRLMSREDPDVCEGLRSVLAQEGVDVLLNGSCNPYQTHDLCPATYA
jgi:pyruvate/2-oxoglutarate dehydrogenase complex dihydrolipoamide dehydrogenase (E3) component